MKILLIFPQADGRTGVYIKKAFENLGHGVRVCDPKTTSIADCEKMTRTMKPDLTFCSRTGMLSAIAKELKRDSGKLAMWNVDVRDDVNHWKVLFPLMRQCDKFFTVGGVEDYHAAGFENAVWLPQGIDPDVHKPFNPSALQMGIYGCDILFVGSYGGLWEGRKEFLDKLMFNDKYSVKIFGPGSPMNLPFLSDTEANVAYNCAKVNVGFSGWPNVSQYTSVRDWKILATGKPLFTRCQHDIFKFIKTRTFYDFDDFMDNCFEYIENEAGNGVDSLCSLARVKAMKEEHTYTHRIKQALEILYAKK